MKRIDVIKTSKKSALRSVQRILREFNQEVWASQKNRGIERELLLVARSSGTILGGLIATTRRKWIKILIMAVEKQHRKEGIGRLLLERAELEARRRGCDFAFVDTMTYQAPGFYVAMGFRETGRIVNWDSNGHDKVFLVKNL